MKAPRQLPVPLIIKMEDSAKNNADALFFHKQTKFAMLFVTPAEWRKYEKSY